MIEFEEYKVRLNDLRPKLAELRASLNIDHALEELERLHSMQESEGFWDDTGRWRTPSPNTTTWRPSGRTS